MATKKLRVRHKKRTYRQRRSQRRVGGAWGSLPSFNMPNMPNNLNEFKTRAATLAQENAAKFGPAISSFKSSINNTATAFTDKAKQYKEKLINEAVTFIKPKFDEYRDKFINIIQVKIDLLNNKEKQQQLTDIEKKLKEKLPELINMLKNRNNEQTGGRSKRTTRRKIQKGGFIGSLIFMLTSNQGREKIINELNNDPEMFNMILGVIVGIFGENSPVSTFIRNFLIKPVPQQ